MDPTANILVLAAAGCVLGLIATWRRNRCTRGGKEHNFQATVTRSESFPTGFDPNHPMVAFASDVKLTAEIYHGHVCTRCGKVTNVASQPNADWVPPPQGPIPKA